MFKSKYSTVLTVFLIILIIAIIIIILILGINVYKQYLDKRESEKIFEELTGRQ